MQAQPDNEPLLENPEPTAQPVADYKQVDIFGWANNLVQYVDELKITLYFFNKNRTVYKVKLVGDAMRQLRPLFIDEILEFILAGADVGLRVRGFEEAEQEDHVLQYTQTTKVERLTEVLNWIKHQSHEIEEFKDEDHDLKRMKGVVARCWHKDLDHTFYVVKSLPTSQIMKGNTAWMLREGSFKPFDTQSALKIPGENQLLVIDQDLFVFSQAKLKSLFAYDAKAALIAAAKAQEIERQFQLSFEAGADFQTLLKDKPTLVKKLQKIEPSLVKQQDLINHAEEMGTNLMTDDAGRIIIMDSKDLTTFVNLLNDDIIESPMTGLRYEIIKKRPLKITESEDTI